MFKKVMKQIGRIIPDLTISGGLLFVYLTGAYLALPATVQLISLKTILVSLGFLHAHIVGKLAFPAVDWRNDEDAYAKIIRIALYCMFVHGYTTGG